MRVRRLGFVLRGLGSSCRVLQDGNEDRSGTAPRSLPWWLPALADASLRMTQRRA